jgi:eukaryotic-like serine/threonine-protein kinase
VVDDMRKQLGESAQSVQRFSKPMFGGRPSSLEVLKAYADGERMAIAGKLQDAVPLLQHAVEVDPLFTMAFADLGGIYTDLGERDLANAAFARAFELRNSVDERDRFFIISAYDDLVTGDIQSSLHNYREWSEEYPGNPTPFLKLADLDVQMGVPAQALAPAQRALQLDPSNPAAYMVLARAQMHLDQFEQAAETCRLAIQRHLDDEQVHAFLLQIAFLRLDQATIDAEIAWAKGSDAQAAMELEQGLMDFAQGKARAGAAIFAAVSDAYRRAGQEEQANRTLERVPRIEAELGMSDAAHALLSRLPAIEGSTDVPVAWAHVGETAHAEALLKSELDSHLSNALWQNVDGPQIRAAIALNQGKPAEAVDDLRPALPYDLRSFDVPAMRGRAYLLAGKPALAAAEFGKIIDHSGIEPLSHDYPLAQLGMARALAAQGKTDDATMKYKLVMEIWKDADPDLPRLREAKSELARLASGGAAVGSAANSTLASKPARKPAAARR